jgi:hypothetical protein
VIDLPAKKTPKRINSSNPAKIVTMTAIKEEDENEEDFQQYIDHNGDSSSKRLESHESVEL